MFTKLSVPAAVDEGKYIALINVSINHIMQEMSENIEQKYAEFINLHHQNMDYNQSNAALPFRLVNNFMNLWRSYTTELSSKKNYLSFFDQCQPMAELSLTKFRQTIKELEDKEEKTMNSIAEVLGECYLFCNIYEHCLIACNNENRVPIESIIKSGNSETFHFFEKSAKSVPVRPELLSNNKNVNINKRPHGGAENRESVSKRINFISPKKTSKPILIAENGNIILSNKFKDLEIEEIPVSSTDEDIELVKNPLNRNRKTRNYQNNRRSKSNIDRIIEDVASDTSKNYFNFTPSTNAAENVNNIVIDNSSDNMCKPNPNMDPTVNNTGNNIVSNEDIVNMDTAPLQSAQQARREIPPPIMVRPNESFINFMRNLSQNMGYKVSGKITGEFIQIKPTTTDSHRAITDCFNKDKQEYYIINPKSTRPLKVVFRGLPIDSDTNQIEQELKELGFAPNKITQMTKGPERRKMPLFLVQLAKTEGFENIYKLNEFLYSIIKVEKYNNNGNVAQCHSCQLFGHSSHVCSMAPRCVKCAGNHLTANCPTQGRIDKPVCANCGGEHPASFRKCPKFPLPRNVIRNNATVKPNLSFANAARSTAPQIPPSQRGADRATNLSTNVITNSASTSAAAPPPPLNNELKDTLEFLNELSKDRELLTLIHALRNALPKVRAATTKLDSLFILLEALRVPLSL